jgi:nucleoside-diphosphate-sugar epimerase
MGHTVYGVRRRAGHAGAAHSLVADVGDRDAIVDVLPNRIDNVVYLVSADARTAEAYRAAYVDGVRNVIDALRSRRSNLRRFVFVSSTRVYPQHHGDWVDESSPVRARDFASEALLEGEQSVRDAAWPSTVVRLAGIYGPGRTRTIDLVRSGDAACPDGPDDYTNRIHRHDAAGLIAHLLASSAPVPETVLGVDTEPARRCEVYRWIARALALAPPRLVTPSAGQRGGKRCSSALVVRMGYRLAYPTYREGYGALIGEMTAS